MIYFMAMGILSDVAEENEPQDFFVEAHVEAEPVNNMVPQILLKVKWLCYGYSSTLQILFCVFRNQT